MSQMDRRQALKLFAALGGTGLAAACSTDTGTEAADGPVSDQPVRIGLIAPQTGGYKPIGDEIAKGFQLFLELNEGRLGGHPVELIQADEGESAQTGKAALDGLLKQNVLALTGVVNSSVMLGIRDAVEQAKVPLVGSNASPATLQSVVYIWRTSYVNDEPGRALAPYVAQQVPRGKKIVIIAPDGQSGRDAVAGFQQGFGAADPRISGSVLWTEFSTNPGKGAFSAKIEQLRDRNPDAIFCFYAGAAAVEFLRQLRGSGYRNPIYAPGFLTEGSVLSELKADEAEGIVTALNYSADLNNSANRRFASAFRKAHGASPTTYAMASYDAAQVLNKAIRIAGVKPTPQQVNLALGNVGQIDSPRGPWQFNQPRTPQQKWYLRKVQRDGQLLSNVLINELATLG
ncbi:ABC transporter substrate-binding protein [Micromonospora sp. NBC_01796]|uniref:ABC transporter substrate-binding protein n=1 Tax=Micromonospora sp. NBC_01796 TaxID=2975987 RepID=UPI002DDBE1CA|nr:ABC transporter substrate-binding protein [Micromonospora sp. NBC_01796]WSA88494.1 ABC transporter substrate-binding protein [Micromonospora sp. NBC_01796]